MPLNANVDTADSTGQQWSHSTSTQCPLTQKEAGIYGNEVDFHSLVGIVMHPSCRAGYGPFACALATTWGNGLDSVWLGMVELDRLAFASSVVVQI